MQTNALEYSDFQIKVMCIPEEYDVFLGGGRGGAKSYCLVLLALKHIEKYGNAARILYVRQTYKGLADMECLTRDVFGLVYGNGARYNASEHVWKFGNGGYFELAQLETASDYTKFQGRSFNLCLWMKPAIS
jgi:hypothetical protein